jgi:hypothetical protein
MRDKCNQVSREDAMPRSWTHMDRLYARVKSFGLDGLTPHERRYFAMWWFFAEVNNGGIHQYFFNDAGQLALDALRGFADIGAMQTVGIMEHAIGLFPGGVVPAGLADRRTELGAMEKPQLAELDSLSREFYESGEDVAALMETFIAENRNHFPALFEA